MAAIYRISEFKEEYKDHYPFPNSIPRMIFPKVGDHLKVSQVILLSNNQQRCYQFYYKPIQSNFTLRRLLFYILSTPIVEFLYISSLKGIFQVLPKFVKNIKIRTISYHILQDGQLYIDFMTRQKRYLQTYSFKTKIIVLSKTIIWLGKLAK